MTTTHSARIGRLCSNHQRLIGYAAADHLDNPTIELARLFKRYEAQCAEGFRCDEISNSPGQAPSDGDA